MESLPFIAWCLEHLNYWVIMLLMTIESSFVPFPSEIVVPPAAYLSAGEDARLNVFLVVLSASIGSILGALINYYLSVYLGRPLIYRLANSWVGRLCLIDEEKIQKAEAYFNNHGAVGTFVGRLIPGIRQLISIPAGLSRMDMKKFLVYTFLGATIWNIILAAIGYYLAGVVPYEQLDNYVDQYGHDIKMVILALLAIAVAYFVFKQFRKK
ncbi:MAG: DedA family protein [Bacteroidaceae bacterium]|nr:DedA family protein [Prevotellaceae bacterium]MDY5631850.1 DedA family protein [Bacteroidaceae bacterium]